MSTPSQQLAAVSPNGNGNGNGKAPVGAVLVCGGGIAGIQASLDLSAAGFRVFLVEESPTIGGGMARLDKTFPTGQKWHLARQAPADVKYVVCNADEGEPGAYMDRTVLEGDPHAVLEGMLIGSYTIGATEGFIYVRSEYPLAIEILEHAIDQAEKHGLLGDDIFGSG